MSAKKTTTKKATPKASKPPKAKTGTADIKLLKGTPSTKRPPNNPDVPQETIDQLNSVLNAIKTMLDDCRKAKGFSAWSLRYAQTPHINSWSFARGKTPKLSGVAG